MEIILARHGKPNFAPWPWISPRQMRDWIRVYNQAGVRMDDVPSNVVTKASVSGVIASSTLPRCVQSAQALGQTKSFLAEAMFREADLPHGQWCMPKLPPSMWGVVYRLSWYCGYSAQTESLLQATARARVAAERLVQLAQAHGSVFLIGHGIMNMLIAKQLLVLGWAGPRRPASNYWQFSVYRAPA